jgi:hypothetical protein
MIVKKQVQDIIRQLPNDCTIEDIQYRLYVLETVQKRIAMADRGETVSHAAVKKRMAKWLAK